MVYTIDRDTPITLDVVNEYFLDHFTSPRRTEQTKLRDAYLGKYEILKTKKPNFKPNNKLVANYAKYIVDTFCGYFDGKPFTVSSQNELVQEAVDRFNNLNVSDFRNYELIKRSAIFGNCYELIYQDEEGNTKNAVLDPLDTFVVFDDTVEQKPVFAVTYRIDDDLNIKGDLYTNDTVYSFSGEQTAITSLTEVGRNEYYEVPIIEYRFNTERQSIFENVLSMINSYNKTLSEKANDVEYLGDSYLVMKNVDLGAFAELDPQEQLQEMMKGIRENRIMLVNSSSPESGPLPEIEFLGKPEADNTQEHLLERLKDDIFTTAMVANISEKDFGTSSGIALQYKLQDMRSLAKVAQRNLILSFKHRYKLVFSFAKNISPTLSDEWSSLEFNFYENLPVNKLEVAQTLAAFKGLVSDETALKEAGIDNPMEELERMEKEQEGNLMDFQKVSANEE